MSKHAKHLVQSLALLAITLVVIACGATGQAADDATANAAAKATANAPAGASSSTAAQPAEQRAPDVRTTEAGVPLLTQDELLAEIDAGSAPLILDVRTAEEFAEGHVPGAVNISHDELATRLAEIDAARRSGVIVYCRSGRRAAIAEDLLQSEGFQNVKHLEGDMLAWLEAGRPTEKPER